jgi:bacillithiol system protein YtxJ
MPFFPQGSLSMICQYRLLAGVLAVIAVSSSCAGNRKGLGEVVMLTTMAELNEFLEETSKKSALIFKHSTNCPISARAYQEFQDFTRNSPLAKEVELALVRVIEERPISQEIARQSGVKHASPQILLMVQGKVAWQTSHYAITRSSIEEAIRQYSQIQ